jgi:hypothetical protein
MDYGTMCEKVSRLRFSMEKFLPARIAGHLVALSLLIAFNLAVQPRMVHAVQDGCPEIVRTEAIFGEPFGVGMVSFRLPFQQDDSFDPNLIVRTGAVQVAEKNHRIFYPAEGRPPAARFFRKVFGQSKTPAEEIISVWFLFRGNAPLELSVWGCEGIKVEVTPVPGRQQKRERLLKQWWREFQAANFANNSEGDFPDLVNAYLGEMLSSRFLVDRPARRRPVNDPFRKTIELLTDLDPLSSNLIGEWFDGRQGFEPTDQALPPAIPWTPVIVNNLPEEIPIEPIAFKVPKDCFYLRFGTWDNQIWLKRLTEEHGGDLSRMVRLRGFRPKVQSKFLTQLALESSQIDQWFGGNLISDVAVVGRDTYFETGPSVGVMLQSKDTNALAARIEKRRENFAAENKLNISILEIAGQRVSFMGSPDNRFRSFHVISGDTHLFTNSRTIAESFLKCSEEKSSLAETPEFRYLRTQMPLEREDTIFVYFSTEFFRKLLEPAYQIELYRRGQAITEMQVTQLARIAAANEGFPNAPLEFLIGNRFLPPVFATRPQGSAIEVVDGVWLDRERGQRGFFMPIADTQIDRISQSERDWYVERAKFFVENVRQLDPMVAAIQRFQQNDKIERIVFDARLAPFGQEKYGWLTSSLGPPMEFEVKGNENELIRLQLSVKGGVWNRNVPKHQLFAAIQGDEQLNLNLTPESFFDSWKTLKEIPGYLGAWPRPGTLDWMPKLGGPPDAEGFTYSRLLDLWRLQFGDFSVLSFEKDRLEGLRGKLKVVASERPAQMRVSVGDFGQSQLNGWANVVNYRRAWETSIANAQLLNLISEQFHIQTEDSLAFAEQLLDVQLTCALGGKYQLQEIPGRKIWVSTAWPDFSQPQIPSTYSAPFLNWFRGLEAELMEVGNQYSLHGYLDLERSASTGASLPSIDLFKGLQSLFPAKKEEKK